MFASPQCIWGIGRGGRRTALTLAFVERNWLREILLFLCHRFQYCRWSWPEFRSRSLTFTTVLVTKMVMAVTVTVLTIPRHTTEGVYEGEQVNDLKQGHGKFSWSDGERKIRHRPRLCFLPSRRNQCSRKKNCPKKIPAEHQMKNDIYLRRFYQRLLPVMATMKTLPNSSESCVYWNKCTIDLSWQQDPEGETSSPRFKTNVFQKDSETHFMCCRLKDPFIVELNILSFLNPNGSCLREYCLSCVCQQRLWCRSMRNITSVGKLLYR